MWKMHISNFPTFFFIDEVAKIQEKQKNLKQNATKFINFWTSITIVSISQNL
jgi:hypothetical protein